MLNFYQSCFDPNIDGTKASLASFRTNVATGDLYEDLPVSKFFVEAAMLMTTSHCQAMGFVQGTKEQQFGVAWTMPGSTTSFWATLDFKTGRFVTNAKNNFARHGLGLMGFGAALAARSHSFRSTWVSHLTTMAEDHVNAVSDDNLKALAAELSRGLELMAPGKDTTNYLFEQSTEMSGPQVEDLRHHFVTIEDFLALVDTFDSPSEVPTRFKGPQLKQVRNLIRRRKHTVLLGPPGVGKTVSAFEALAMEGFAEAGIDYQLFTGHDEVKSADFLGGWQPSGDPSRPYVWVNGALVRAMIANDGRGQPILVEEFTRMPTRAQNMFISALSDGYVILNEKPGVDGKGEIIRAGEDFVLLADMNVDPAADDIELYGAAFSSRVRKVEYDYPSLAALTEILSGEMENLNPSIRLGVTSVYDQMMKRWNAAEVSQPVSPRACVQWAEEINAILEERGASDSAVVRTAAWQAAGLTWLRDVAGTDEKLRKTIMSDVEAKFRQAFNRKK